MEEKKQFDFNNAVQDILAGKNINGKDGVLAPLVKQLVEADLCISILFINIFTIF